MNDESGEAPYNRVIKTVAVHASSTWPCTQFCQPNGIGQLQAVYHAIISTHKAIQLTKPVLANVVRLLENPRKKMENYKLVLPEHLNHYGFLFGGYLLKFVDEIAWIAASLDYPNFNFVTIGMDKVEFRKSVRQGTILRFNTSKTRVGTTSATYLVEVFCDKQISAGQPKESESVFSTSVTMVRVNQNGDKQEIDDQS